MIATMFATGATVNATTIGSEESEVATVKTTTALEPSHRDFLELAAPLLHDAEREVFLALTENYRRDVFVQRFWRTRDPYPDTPRNELRERLEETFLEQRQQLAESSEDEAKLLLLHGKPTRQFRDSCQLLQPVNIWYYRSSPLVPAEFFAVFHRRQRQWTLWKPRDGVEVLLMRAGTGFGLDEIVERIQRECSRGDELVQALHLSLDWDTVHERALGTPDPEWAQAFLLASAQAGTDAHSQLSATSQFVGRRQSRVVVQTALTIPAAALDELANHQSGDGNGDGDHDDLQLLLNGEIVRNDELFDSFRYRFVVPRNQDGSLSPSLMVERYLRPGEYRLVLQLQHAASGQSFHLDEELTVPVLQAIQDPPEQLITADLDEPAEAADTTADAAADAADGLETSSSRSTRELPTSLRLSIPSRDLLVGPFRAEAILEGRSVNRVAFELDGERVLSKGKPPYSVELDAGRVPRTHQLVARAFDASGNQVASDEVTLNAGPRRFGVRLIEPQRGTKYTDRLRAVAEVNVPPLEELEHVEFYLNEQLMATLYQRPFALPITIPKDLPLAFVRVVGKLKNGQQTEDLVFVNSPHDVEYIDVDLVEVYTTVTNRRGLPVKDLTKEQFSVFEDGREQRIEEFRQVKDLPIHACVLFDTSTSMLERLEEAKGAAAHFFEQVLKDRDRACLMTFNDVHELVVDFTHSPEVLAGGLKDVAVEGETALYDSLIHTLYLFNGMRGKRAIILLSDGADSKSTYRFAEVLEFARRSEVTIHAIGVDIQTRDMEARMKLSQLAKETGGRTFFIDTIRELRRVYDLIEEDLRSQYLLAYQSDHGSANDNGEHDSKSSKHRQGSSPGDGFRAVKVTVDQKGLKARALSGYYP